MKYNIEVWGCQMNEHDAETLAGLVESMGYTRTHDSHKADLVMLHTCCVREKAESKVLTRIGVLQKMKRDNPDLVIAVGGCMTQQENVAQYIRKHFHGVDILFGTHNLHRFPELLRAARHTGRSVLEILPEHQGVSESAPAVRNDRFRAYVDIVYGCDNFCSYCIVPHVRGRERSRTIDHIADEVRMLLSQGYKDIMLLGQNVNSYGKNLPGAPRFSDLLRELDALGTYRLRYMTSHPRDFSEELIDTIARSKNVCDHFHLPLQSGSDRILGRMRRGYDQKHYLKTVRRITERFERPVLTTDIIVGFPSETEEDFEQTLEVVRSARFDQAFTFLYSPRDGTPAASMKKQVPEDVKHERFERLLALQNEISAQKNEAMLGRTVDVLLEGPSKNDPSVLTGRTSGSKIVHVKTDERFIGSLLPVRITDARTWSLTGEPIQGE